MNAHSDSHFTLTSMDPFYYKILTEMFSDNEMVDVQQTSIYEYEFSTEKFDSILDVPIFGVRDKADENRNFICREYDLIAAENLALHLKSEGILSIVLPARITFGGGSVKELDGMTASEYAQSIGDEPNNVSHRYRRAINKLKKSFEKTSFSCVPYGYRVGSLSYKKKL